MDSYLNHFPLSVVADKATHLLLTSFCFVPKYFLYLSNRMIYIKGIIIGELELKLSQYADDTTILLDGSEQSLDAALQTLSIFAKIRK